jgi:drug/metabolite transporter (DMT)-like permease
MQRPVRGGALRPSTIVSLITGVVVALAGLALGILAFVERGSHRPWFYWIAPLLAIGFAGVMANLIAQYYVKVGRLEVKGRPRK